MTRRSAVGFDRKLELAWLDAAVARVANAGESDDVREQIWDFLEGVVGGDKPRSARGKTTTVLNRIWSDVPSDAVPLRDRAIERLEDALPNERLALHWAMMIGTYPIFTDVASTIGKLTALQGEFTLDVLTRRVIKAWGDRSTVKRATQRIVRSMVDWQVLRDTEDRGIYERAERSLSLGDAFSPLVLEALLVDAEEDTIPLEQLLAHPALFPFELTFDIDRVRKMPQFRFYRQGVDVDVVELLKSA